MNNWKEDIPPTKDGRAWYSKQARLSMIEIHYAHRILRQRLNHQYQMKDIFEGWDSDKVTKIFNKYCGNIYYNKSDNFFTLDVIEAGIYHLEGGIEINPWFIPRFYIVNSKTKTVITPGMEGADLRLLGYDVYNPEKPKAECILFAAFKDYDELEVLVENTMNIWKDFWVCFLKASNIEIPPELKDHQPTFPKSPSPFR